MGTWWDHHVYWPFPHLKPQCDCSIWGLTVCPGDRDWPLSVWLAELFMTFLWFYWGFPGGTSGKELPANAGDIKMLVQSLGQEDPLEEGMATHSSILAWRFPWTEETGGLWFIESQRVGHDWSDLPHRHTHPQERSWSRYCRNKLQTQPTFKKPMAKGKFSSFP